MRGTQQAEIVVLLSGGIDSTATVAFYLSLRRPVAALFIDYGQAAARHERAASRRVCSHYDVLLMERSLTGAFPKGEGEISMRNTVLASVAIMERPVSAWGVALGIHAGTAYPDCSPEFASQLRALAAVQRCGVEILTPFLDWTKPDVLAFCGEHDVPIDMTYSCERGAEPPCGQCLSCGDRRGLDARAKVQAHT